MYLLPQASQQQLVHHSSPSPPSTSSSTTLSRSFLRPDAPLWAASQRSSAHVVLIPKKKGTKSALDHCA